jgi:hypothetical protein
MANVCASGSPSLTSADAFQTQLRSLPTFGDNFISGTTFNRLAQRLPSDIHWRLLTIVVCANLKCLISPHDQTSLLVFLVFQQPNIPCPTLLPLPGVSIKTEELGPHLESLLLHFLICLCFHRFSQVNNRFKMYIRGLGCLLIILRLIPLSGERLKIL